MTYSILLTITFLTFAMLAWRDLKMALILLAGLLPIYLLRFSIGPVPSTALEFLILITFLIWTFKLRDAIFRQNVSECVLKLRVWVRPTMLLIAAASIGVAVAPAVFSALGIWKAYFIEPILVAIMMATTLKPKDVSSVLKSLAVSSIILSVIGILQYLTGLGIPSPWDIELRITSIFDYPNALGLFVGPVVTIAMMGWVLDVGGWITKTHNTTKHPAFDITLWTATIILGAIAITLSKTEAAMVAIPAALLITFLISPARIWRTSPPHKWQVSVGALLAFILLLGFVSPVREKIFLQDYSGQVRLSQWSETVELLKNHPFFGAGLNGYPIALKPYHDSTAYEIFQYPHNIFLNIWVELGVLGLIAFFWFAFLFFRKTLQTTNYNLLFYRSSLPLPPYSFTAWSTFPILKMI